VVSEHEAFAVHDALHGVQKVIQSEDLKEGGKLSRKSARRAGKAASAAATQ